MTFDTETVGGEEMNGFGLSTRTNHLAREHPMTLTNGSEVACLYPPHALIGVTSFCPSEQRLKNGVIHRLEHRVTVDEFISVEVSSRKGLKQRGVLDLLARLSTSDTLLVSELSRLGRSLSQIVFLVDQLVKKRVRFVAIKEGIEFAGQTDLQTKVMVTLFGLFAEIERDLISQRTKEGLAAARAKGKI